ncbi:SMP-30/gluconolactonase/LRE family protein [Crossiella sp. CA-258035]|uniref:SMP-30/gluconolactonase/LRE family protein n=1 Tax=Crossiella sp. CA-258035 TaxID=2981138 RepID=UPI0024BCAB68|nr:SMP-30/gluconolactonase/LRE family protein [Crossiella sp. CA-258035]WHT22921.1 SMP-30/gluconolactonase/LRE family protein [Crossiella sp. CA-258035]
MTTVLLDGLAVGESPRWHQGRLWFCHWGADEIVAVDPAGRAEVIMHDPEIVPHSIDWLPDGRLLIVPRGEGYQGLLQRREPDGSLVTHADLRPLAAGWNELVVDGRGNTYVNGSDFDFLGFLEGRAEFIPGVIALVTPDGAVRQVAEGIEFGNGMVVSQDNSTLVVAESFAGRLTAFDITEDGTLTNRRIWAEGVGPDGITMDADGAIWTSLTDHDCALVREGGEVVRTIELDRNPFACALGGADGRTLFVMAARWNPEDPFGGPRTGQVLTTSVAVPGAGWPGRG